MTAAPGATPRRTADLAPIGAALLAGLLTAAPIAIIGAVGRQRGGEEATFFHLVTLVAALSVVAAVYGWRGAPPAFPRPMNSAWSMTVLGVLFGSVALACVRGLEWYYLSTGIISVAIFLLITWSLVRLSLGLYFASQTLGSVFGSLVMDQIGAFGAMEREVTLARLAGVLMVAAGVVVVRAAK